jgi:hypothetical protein
VVSSALPLAAFGTLGAGPICASEGKLQLPAASIPQQLLKRLIVTSQVSYLAAAEANDRTCLRRLADLLMATATAEAEERARAQEQHRRATPFGPWPEDAEAAAFEEVPVARVVAR